MYFQHEIMEQEGFLSHDGCHDPTLSFGVVCRLLAHISCCSKTSYTDSLPSISACAWKTAPDDVTVEIVYLEYVSCLLYFFLCYTPLVSFTVVSFVTEKWWFLIVGDFTSTVVFLNSTINRNAVKSVFTQLHCKLHDCNS